MNRKTYTIERTYPYVKLVERDLRHADIGRNNVCKINGIVRSAPTRAVAWRYQTDVDSAGWIYSQKTALALCRENPDVITFSRPACITGATRITWTRWEDDDFRHALILYISDNYATPEDDETLNDWFGLSQPDGRTAAAWGREFAAFCRKLREDRRAEER